MKPACCALEGSEKRHHGAENPSARDFPPHCPNITSILGGLSTELPAEFREFGSGFGVAEVSLFYKESLICSLPFDRN